MKETLQQVGSRIVFSEQDLTGLIPLIDSLQKDYSHCALIMDKHVHKLYSSKFLSLPIDIITIPQGEHSKTLETATQVWNQLFEQGFDRKSLIIGLGGGVTTDLAGFVASTYMRGIDVIYIPTTLLGMVDAAIGGKTAVNLGQGKNIIGAIHHPQSIYICEKFLETLPEREFIAGLAEVIKSTIIGDSELFFEMEQSIDQLRQREPQLIRTILQRTTQLKSHIVAQDEKDHGIRAQLNYGHTFGHSIESLTNYKLLLHGEAVSIGMSCAAHIAQKLGLTDQTFVDRQDALCRSIGLPTTLPNIDDKKLISLMKQDKKSNFQKINLIVPEKVGKVITVSDVREDLILEVLKEKRQRDLIERN